MSEHDNDIPEWSMAAGDEGLVPPGKPETNEDEDRPLEGPDPLLSPLHEGQLTLMPTADPEPDTAPEPPRAELHEVGSLPPLLEDDGPVIPPEPDETVVPPLPDSPDAETEEFLPVEPYDDLVVAEPEGADAASWSEPGDVPVRPDDTAAWAGVTVYSSSASVYDLPFLDRERPKREPSVPHWVWWTLIGVVLALALAIGGLFWYQRTLLVEVPDVTGESLSVAKETLADAGFEVRVRDRRFSAAEPDQVLAQTPGAGDQASRGDIVYLVVSAGTEEVEIPDVVGDKLPKVREQLEGLGLLVIVDPVVSDVASDTVLGTTPAAGTIVRTGDSIRLTVAAPVGSASNGLSPYDLTGFAVVIDPAPVPGATDTTMEVARRLRSLLEASGASVTVLRSVTDTAAPESARLRAAADATGTIAIGLSIDRTGRPGRNVSIPVTGTPDVLQRAGLLSSSITSALADVAAPAASSTSSTETVLQATRLPWARIRLGSLAARDDQALFADPRWADKVARSIYMALGQIYGVREQQ